MPELDYAGGAVKVTGRNARPLREMYGRRFYNGSPGRLLVPCPDCGFDADELLGGDHGGDCRPTISPAATVRGI